MLLFSIAGSFRSNNTLKRRKETLFQNYRYEWANLPMLCQCLLHCALICHGKRIIITDPARSLLGNIVIGIRHSTGRVLTYCWFCSWSSRQRMLEGLHRERWWSLWLGTSLIHLGHCCCGHLLSHLRIARGSNPDFLLLLLLGRSHSWVTFLFLFLCSSCLHETFRRWHGHESIEWFCLGLASSLLHAR